MGSVGARWQRVTQTLRVSPTGGGGGGGARWSTLAIHTPSGDSAYTPTAPPKSRLTWVLVSFSSSQKSISWDAQILCNVLALFSVMKVPLLER
jgi:hypothetical protein